MCWKLRLKSKPSFPPTLCPPCRCTARLSRAPAPQGRLAGLRHQGVPIMAHPEWPNWGAAASPRVAHAASPSPSSPLSILGCLMDVTAHVSPQKKHCRADARSLLQAVRSGVRLQFPNPSLGEFTATPRTRVQPSRGRPYEHFGHVTLCQGLGGFEPLQRGRARP